MAKGKNTMGSGKGQAPVGGPKKGGIKTTGKHEYRSNIKGLSKSK